MPYETWLNGFTVIGITAGAVVVLVTAIEWIPRIARSHNELRAIAALGAILMLVVPIMNVFLLGNAFGSSAFAFGVGAVAVAALTTIRNVATNGTRN